MVTHAKYLLIMNRNTRDGTPWVLYNLKNKKQTNGIRNLWYASYTTSDTLEKILDLWGVRTNSSTIPCNYRAVAFEEIEELFDGPVPEELVETVYDALESAKKQGI